MQADGQDETPVTPAPAADGGGDAGTTPAPAPTTDAPDAPVAEEGEKTEDQG